MKLIRVGVDLAKSFFQVHCVDRSEKAGWRRKLSRGEWLQTLLERVGPGCQIGMESGAGAHHWARQMEAKGFTVKLIAPQFVKPYVKSNKNDANDAEAMSRPHMRFVSVKSVEQQDILATRRHWRQRLPGQCHRNRHARIRPRPAELCCRFRYLAYSYTSPAVHLPGCRRSCWRSARPRHRAMLLGRRR